LDGISDFHVEFCKMEIRLIFFKEIVGVISLKTEVKYLHPKHLRSREEKSTRRFFLPKVSLISILQKFSKDLRAFSCRIGKVGLVYSRWIFCEK